MQMGQETLGQVIFLRNNVILKLRLSKVFSLAESLVPLAWGHPVARLVL